MVSRILKWVVGAAVIGSFLTANPASIVRQGLWSSPAEAIVGRPATPASVAGVARRTTRRCVARVYPC